MQPEAEPLGGEPENVQTDNGEAFEFDAIASVGARRLMWHPSLCRIVWEELEITPESVDLDYLNARGGLPFFREHYYWWGAQLGKVTSLDVENGKITARKVRLSRHDDVKRYRMDVADGIADAVSLGYRHIEYSLIEQDGDYPICRVTKIQPIELSATSMPADAWSSIIEASIRSAYPNDDAPEAVIAAKPASAGGETATRADTTTQETATMTTPTTASNDASQTPASPTVTRSETPAVEGQAPSAPANDGATASFDPAAFAARSAEFVNIARTGGLTDDVLTRAIADPAMTVDKFKAQALDNLSTRSTTAVTAGNDVVSRGDRQQAMVDAFAARISGGDIEGQATEFARHSFVDFAVESMRMAGDDTITRHMPAHEIMRRSMHTTSDFRDLLTNSVNKALVDLGTDTDETYLTISKKKNLSDFRETKLLDFDNMPRFKRLTEGGEIRRGTIFGSETAVTLETFWIALAVTRQMFVNDGFGVFSDILSTSASTIPGQKNDLLYAAFLYEAQLALAADELSDADKSKILLPEVNAFQNLALDEDGLNAAIVAMTTRRRRDGGRAGVKPKFLLHGPALRTQAIRQTGSWTPATQEDIPVNSGIIPVMDENMPGRSWAIISDPNKGVPAFMHGGLDGESEVMTYDWERVRGRDGFECEAGFDFHGSMVSSHAIVASLDTEAFEALD
ncbi:MAG: hypothetical protein GW854_01665 [Erythrobacter sp.]|nr:hypothetical protein [Erythrobacter sp.]